MALVSENASRKVSIFWPFYVIDITLKKLLRIIVPGKESRLVLLKDSVLDLLILMFGFGAHYATILQDPMWFINKISRAMLELTSNSWDNHWVLTLIVVGIYYGCMNLYRGYEQDNETVMGWVLYKGILLGLGLMCSMVLLALHTLGFSLPSCDWCLSLLEFVQG